MTSILEPFASKRYPNETGTVSVYASVNQQNIPKTDTSGFVTTDQLEADYYDKTEINQKEASLQSSISSNTTNITNLTTEVNNNTEDIEDLKTKSAEYLKYPLYDLKISTMPDMSDSPYYNISGTSDSTGDYLTISHVQNIRYDILKIFNAQGVILINDEVYLTEPNGISFNKSISGSDSVSRPVTKLLSLVTTENSSNNYFNGIKDNVVPTWAYCEANYKTSGGGFPKVLNSSLLNPLSSYQNSLCRLPKQWVQLTATPSMLITYESYKKIRFRGNFFYGQYLDSNNGLSRDDLEAYRTFTFGLFYYKPTLNLDLNSMIQMVYPVVSPTSFGMNIFYEVTFDAQFQLEGLYSTGSSSAGNDYAFIVAGWNNTITTYSGNHDFSLYYSRSQFMIEALE